MTTPERVVTLKRAVEHVVANSIPGDIVECGVWRGGSAMVAALTLRDLEEKRALWLYDTFSGMTPPTERDSHAGIGAAELLAEEPDRTAWVWGEAQIDVAKANLAATGYPDDLIRFVVGPVEETIPREVPHQIALLRLDTDWYESTLHELTHLYPLLAPGGVLIVDDYGHWSGAREAVDEYLGRSVLLARIDYTGRIAVKPS
jgi:O-methyltransferase